eukprot:snap_masked-scaffold_1-processed-gene-29.18-mRNA-1 protein AED:1.00 eAED:1.00 QI:0/0/0/0/1/1/3/0/92
MKTRKLTERLVGDLAPNQYEANKYNKVKRKEVSNNENYEFGTLKRTYLHSFFLYHQSVDDETYAAMIWEWSQYYLEFSEDPRVKRTFPFGKS